MMKHANFASLTFNEAGFYQIKDMIKTIFPTHKIIRRKKDLFYIANLFGNDVGFIHLGIRNGFWRIIGTGVLAEYRRFGYGKAIIEFGISEVRKRFGHAVTLSVEEDNHVAINIYKKLGFVKTEKSKEKINMMLILNN